MAWHLDQAYYSKLIYPDDVADLSDDLVSEQVRVEECRNDSQQEAESEDNVSSRDDVTHKADEIIW